MSQAATAPYESPLLRQVTGPALRPGGLALTQRALEQCRFAPGARVLDIGCGLGASAGHLAQAQGLRVLGLDLSAKMLSEARRSHGALPLIRARAEAIPLAADSLDGVFLECVLSLTPRPQAVLAECRRVLRPQGKLVLSDLYLRHPSEAVPGPPLPGCLGGARGQEAWRALVQDAGLELTAWEDHSPLLRQLAARLAWAHGSTAALWGACGGGEDCRSLAARAARVRPGYFLLLARRKAKRHG